jgi:hypothetical protein
VGYKIAVEGTSMRHVFENTRWHSGPFNTVRKPEAIVYVGKNAGCVVTGRTPIVL